MNGTAKCYVSQSRILEGKRWVAWLDQNRFCSPGAGYQNCEDLENRYNVQLPSRSEIFM